MEWKKKHIYHIRWTPLIVTIYITHVRNCVMGATPMVSLPYGARVGLVEVIVAFVRHIHLLFERFINL